MSALEIQQLPRQEKLKLMEMLWADLSRDEAELESPAWQADALRETAERRALCEQIGQLPYTLIFLESPHRLLDSLADLQIFLGDRPAAAARELTKIYEQVVRGALSQVSAHFSLNEPRGEFVLVVGGYVPQADAQWTETRLRAEIQHELESGRQAKELASDLARKSGWMRREIYKMAQEID